MYADFPRGSARARRARGIAAKHKVLPGDPVHPFTLLELFRTGEAPRLPTHRHHNTASGDCQGCAREHMPYPTICAAFGGVPQFYLAQSRAIFAKQILRAKNWFALSLFATVEAHGKAVGFAQPNPVLCLALPAKRAMLTRAEYVPMKNWWGPRVPNEH